MSKIAPCLWFKNEAEEAAKFYVSLLPDSRIVKIQHNGPDSPAGKAGSVLVVSFTLAGQEFMALNGNPQFEPNHAVSFKIDCVDQAETDHLWDKLSSNGGSTLQCGWLRDRYGFSWQIVPSGFMELIGGPDSAVPPAGTDAAAWHVREGRADIFISYCSASFAFTKSLPDATVVSLPERLATSADYGLTLLPTKNVNAAALALFILSQDGQTILAKNGFTAPLLEPAQ